MAASSATNNQFFNLVSTANGKAAPTATNANGLTNAQVSQGYSTIPGNYNPVTGALNPGASSNGGTTNVTGQAPQVLDGNGKPIPGAPTLDANGNIIPGTGSTAQANSATATAVTNPPSTTPTAAPLNTTATSATSGTTGTPAGIPGLEGGTPLVNGAQATKYNTALTGLNAGGSTAPSDSGSGSAAASNAANNVPVAPDNTGVNTALANDPGYQQIIKDQQAYQSAENQSQTLASQYQSLESQYNIPGMQTQLLNMQAVINGTEDDIRTEVTAANGFATNSQVLALSDARNKTLIQNYNNLQSTLTNAQNQVTTMIGLDKDDQANALNMITTKLGIDEQVANYTQQFQSNAKEGYSTIISAVGINGLYNSLMNSDPTGGALATAAQIMGMTPAEMKSASDTAQQSQNLDTESKQLSIESSESGLATSALDRQSTELDIKNKELMANPSLPNPARANMPGYTNTGVAVTPQLAAPAIASQWQSQGAINSKGQVTPAAYNAGLSLWVGQNLNPADYAAMMAQYKATSGPWVSAYAK